MNRKSQRLAISLCVTGLALSAAAACSSSGAKSPSTGGGANGKALSKSTINIIGPNAQSMAPVWIAQDKGYFKQQGLTVHTTLSKQSASTWVTVLLSGSSDFMQGQASAEVLAAANGAPVKAVAMDEAPSGQFLDISSKAAARISLPATGTTQASAQAQINALKGSKIKIGIDTTTGDSYAWMRHDFSASGVDVGSDVTFVTTGSPLNNVAALKAGKVDAIAEALPYSNQPNTVQVPLFHLPPASESAGQYVLTTNSMTKGHPDTVQAVVTAIAQASQFVKKDQSAAEAIVAPHLKAAGYPSAAQQKMLFDVGYAQFAQLGMPTKTAFDNELTLVNAGNAANNKAKLNLAFSAFADTTYATAAYAKLGIAAGK